MNEWAQLTQLLSQPPGTIVFHLVTLFALQAVLGISLSQWRQQRTDGTARRTAVAAGAVLLAEGTLLLLALLWQRDPQMAAAYLPPLYQTAHGITAVFLTWALATPRAPRRRNLSNALLLAALVTLAIMTVSFSQSWQQQAAGQPFTRTTQATIGYAFQAGVLVLGLFITLWQPQARATLRPIILLILLGAYAIQLFGGQPQAIPAESNALFWLRLGYLIVLPLWAAHAYRRAFAALPSVAAPTTAVALPEWHSLLRELTDVISSMHPQPTLIAALELVEKVTQARFVALALAENDGQRLTLTTNLPQVERNLPRTLSINPDDWPAFRLAREQEESIELRPNGLGARQLHLLYTELGLPGSLGAIYLCPLRVKTEWLGLLLLSHPQGSAAWTEEERAAIAPLAAYIAQALDNSRLHTQTAVAAPVPVVEAPDSGRLIALEEAQKRLESELEVWQARARQAEGRAAEARKQAQDLAETLHELEQVNRDEQIRELEAEIEALRESLLSAEEAMAIAAAGEAALSTEWVMRTITRYSGQLEEAQARIELLEAQLRQQSAQESTVRLVQALQEIRTPMTAVISYADLLNQTATELLPEQQTFVAHILTNAQRVEQMLAQLLVEPTTTEATPGLEADQSANLEEVLETAVHAIIPHLRENQQRLELNVSADLPPLSIHHTILQQILVGLLQNATLASGPHGHITISAQTKALAAPISNDREEILKFVQINVQDSGPGISSANRAYVFTPPPPYMTGPIPGLGSNAQALAEVRNLAVAHGARVWVDGEPGQGCTFSILFPIATTEVTFPPANNGDQGAKL